MARAGAGRGVGEAFGAHAAGLWNAGPHYGLQLDLWGHRLVVPARCLPGSKVSFPAEWRSLRLKRSAGAGGMAKTKITEREVNTLRTASRRTGKSVFLWDTELRGLGLCITANGLGTWLVQKWVGGRRGKLKRIVIGHLPPMTVEEARSKARSGALRAILEAEAEKLHVSASQTEHVQADGFGKIPPTPSCRT